MAPRIIECEQGEPEWYAARAGIVTASEFATVMASGKAGGRSVTRDRYLRQLAGEILTEEPAPEGYSNAFMERGKQLENEARELYAFLRDAEPVRVGFVANDAHRAGCSPDSLIGATAGLEIKVAIPAVQIERLQRGSLPPEHVAQVQGSLWVTERESWEFVSYCPKLPPLILTVRRDPAYIATLAAAVAVFNDELDAVVERIRRYGEDPGNVVRGQFRESVVVPA